MLSKQLLYKMKLIFLYSTFLGKSDENGVVREIILIIYLMQALLKATFFKIFIDMGTFS